ncbi:DUF4349 domain-containing protein [Pimelobacter simplex]|uniref:DUF4349 domain-containing protein n=1 Tax=Nocardioides simplex TaxID=2045 RepID=UPI0027E374F1|nr:DUF4349 domain-containing protein [Pimelobacter simplex]
MKQTRSRLTLALAGAAAVVSLAACAGSGGDSDSADADGSSGGRAAVAATRDAPEAGDLGTLSKQESAADADPAAGAPASPGQQDEATTPAVISTGTVSLEDKDVARTRLEVRKIVDRFRGSVSEQETVTGDKGEVASARLVLRVPAAQFDEVVTALEDVATLTDSSTSSEDVTGEVVDVEARIRAQRKSVERIETLLARAETIEQVVAVETQLARRQADLDALVSRQKWLADQTGMSTVSVYIQQPAQKDDDGDDDKGGFLGGLERGWDAFVDGLGGAALVLGFALPWLIVLALLGAPLAWALRRRAGRRPAGPTAPTDPTPPPTSPPAAATP